MSRTFSDRDVMHFLDLCDLLGVSVWLDGGWGVDALLGEQTRPHADLDIMVQWKHLPALVDGLHSSGFSDVDRDDTRPWNFVMGDADGHEIDFHVFRFSDDGDSAIYGPLTGPRPDSWTFPASSFDAEGSVSGRTVRCLTAEYQVQSHSGYELKEKDFADVRALCNRFGIQLPAEYERPAR